MNIFKLTYDSFAGLVTHTFFTHSAAVTWAKARGVPLNITQS